MTLTFFKAAPPYDKTNGFWEQRMWTNGFSGPMSIIEARRLAGMLGGRFFNIELPEINTMTDFLAKLGAELPSDFKEIIPGRADHVEMQTAIVNPPDLEKLREEQRMQTLVEIVMNAKASETKNKVRKVIGSELPAYAEQVKVLDEAKKKGEFDFTQYIGKKRDIHNIFKAYAILILKDRFTLTEE